MNMSDYFPNFVLRDPRGEPAPLVWHEAAHALVAYRHGLTVQHIDLVGAHAACPNAGIDIEIDPNLCYWDRMAHFCKIGMAAVAGPVAESLRTGQLIWRTDGHIALAMAGRVDGTHPAAAPLRERRRAT